MKKITERFKSCKYTLVRFLLFLKSKPKVLS